MGRIYYTLPTVRFGRVAKLFFFLDAATCIALWLTGGHSKYMVNSITEWKITTSVFELACLSLLKLIILFPIFGKLEDIAMAQIEDPYNPLLKKRKAIMHVSTFILSLLSIAYTTTKGVLILLNKSYEDMHVTYQACCIAAFAFSLLELLLCVLYPVFLRKLKILRVKHKLNDEGIEEDEDGKPKTPKAAPVNLKRLLSLAKPEAFLLSIGIIFLVVAAVANMATPYYFGKVIDKANKQSPMSEVNKEILILSVIGVIGAVGSCIRSWVFTLAGIRVACTIRKDLFKSIIKQDIAFFDTNRTGELTNRLSSDTQVVQNAVTVNISMLVRYIFQIIGSLVFMFKLSPSLTGVLLSCIPLVAIGAVQYGKFVQKIQKNFQDELAAAGTTAEENLSSIRTVRSFSGEPRACKQYNVDIDRSYTEGKKLASSYGVFSGLMGVVVQGAVVLVLWYGAKLVAEGEISVGILTSFMLYTLNVAMAFAFVSSLFGDFMKAVGASTRIFELMDRKPEVKNDGGIVLKEIPCQVELQNISFTYPSRPDTKVLKDINFLMKPGSVVALVGPSGGGKSTIVNLIEKFYEPDTGIVKLGDYDMSTLDPSWFRRRISMVGQEPVLFACSIRDNIAYGKECTNEEVEDVAKQANAHEFISGFEDSYNTLVGERGVRLSGGQKQRIAIARALIMNPDILLLDEATSALDAESEHLVQEAIDRAMKGRTVLVIAHRLSTVRNASEVIVINKGVVAERGTHDELIARGGVYKKLVLRQLSAAGMATADIHINVANDDIDDIDIDDNGYDDFEQ
ncbi:uncharacterized protein LOC144449221 [Glandiceps talaboti]